MRPYIILNGRNSQTVKGLMICTLPAIVKPLMRTNREEIDGRAGDIITELGYSAYDRELEIGLYGEYDIDEVVRYFNSSGEVIFSNEPERIYSYTVLNAISFEKLIRYKKAKVTLHVQPYKYSALISRSHTFINQLFEIKDMTKTACGVTFSVSDNILHMTGTANRDIELFLPIDLVLQAGSYVLEATTTDPVGGHFRVCQGAPIDMQSLGRNVVRENGSVSDTLDAVTHYKFLYIFLPKDSVVNADVTLTITAHQLYLRNMGNTVAKPTVTIYGSGVVQLILNGVLILAMNITSEYITIDAEDMNAYKGNTYLNRYVTGDYDDLAFTTGMNKLAWVGNVSSMIVKDYSRWI